MKNQKIIGIDVGGTKCACLLGNTEGKILRKIKFATEVSKGVDYTLGSIKNNIREVLKQGRTKPSEIKRIGVSCGGPLDSIRGIIQSPPNLPGWDNIPLKAILEKEFKAKTSVMNDANACAVAEWKWGAGKGYRNVIFLTFGTGMGAGLIIDNRLYSGTNDMAGEIGHVRMEKIGPVGYGKVGSFEGFCSGGGIAMLAREAATACLKRGEKLSFSCSLEEAGKLTAREISNAAFAGDPVAVEIMNIAGRKLGMGLSILLDILNPEIIIIGSIFLRCKSLLLPEMEKTLREETLPASLRACKITVPKFGEEIGDFAALAAAGISEVRGRKSRAGG